MVDFKFDSVQIRFHREPPEVGLVEMVCHSYIESAIALSDIYFEEPQEFPIFIGWKKWTSSP